MNLKQLTMDNNLISDLEQELMHQKIINNLLLDELFFLREQISNSFPRISSSNLSSEFIEISTSHNCVQNSLKDVKVPSLNILNGGYGNDICRISNFQSDENPVINTPCKNTDINSSCQQLESTEPTISSREEISKLNKNFKKLNLTHSRKVISKTPKSACGPICNFLQNVDLAIAFAFSNSKKDRFYLSKGASKCIKVKYISMEEWERMRVINVSADSEVRVHSYYPLIIIAVSKTIDSTVNRLLCWLNDVMAVYFPLRLGFDDFREIKIMSPLFLLTNIQRHTNLYFYFYSYGLRLADLNFLEIAGNELHMFPSSDKMSCFYNSMVEIKNILSEEDSTVLNQFKEHLSNDNKFHFFNQMKSLGIDIWHNKTGKPFLSCSDDKKYACAFSLEEDGQFVFSENNKSFKSDEEFLYVSKKTEIRLNQAILENISDIRILNVPFPEILWVNGVPGCGKTHYLIHSHKIGEDLILTLTKEGCRELRDSVIKLFSVDKDTARQNYRTLASLMVNGTKRKFNKVIIDEALLMHAGFIGFVVALTGAKIIELVGDEWQIPFVDRDNTKSHFSSPSLFAEITTSNVQTRRCPIDVCYTLASFYPGIFTTSKIAESLSVHTLNINSLPDTENTLYLTHTQQDKQALLNVGVGNKVGSKVLTIHEAQGQTFELVILVRFNRKKLKLYNSIEHSIVAISRHTKLFYYFTAASEDMVSNLIKKVTSAKENLVEWNEKQMLRHSMGLSKEMLIRKKRNDYIECQWPS